MQSAKWKLFGNFNNLQKLNDTQIATDVAIGMRYNQLMNSYNCNNHA